jgi:hypothetical protein
MHARVFHQPAILAGCSHGLCPGGVKLQPAAFGTLMVLKCPRMMSTSNMPSFVTTLPEPRHPPHVAGKLQPTSEQRRAPVHWDSVFAQAAITSSDDIVSRK